MVLQKNQSVKLRSRNDDSSNISSYCIDSLRLPKNMSREIRDFEQHYHEELEYENKRVKN